MIGIGPASVAVPVAALVNRNDNVDMIDAVVALLPHYAPPITVSNTRTASIPFTSAATLMASN